VTDLGPIREPAPAKLNLFLRVVRRRDDGYHDVETAVQPVTLADGVEASPSEDLQLVVVGPEAEGVPRGSDNLVIRAARALAEEAGIGPRARLLVAKKVPVAAGLGGGSADAAAALRALNELWGCGLGADLLAGVAARVGSDVPALVYGGPVLARGRGEAVEPIEVARTWWVLVPQRFGVSAADAYRWWDEDGGVTGPDPAVLLEALRAGDVEAVAGLAFNDLEAPVAGRHPQIEEARGALRSAGALRALLCGSGPTVAGLCRDGPHAEEVAAAVGGIAVGSIGAR